MSDCQNQNGTKRLVPFSELVIGTKFFFGTSVCIKTQEGWTSPLIQFEEVKPELCKFNIVFLTPNRGTMGWLSPDQCVEVIAPHLEGS